MRLTAMLAAVLTLSILALPGCGLLKAVGVMKPPPRNETVTLEVDHVKKFGDSNTIIVPTLYLYLPVEGSASASSDSTAIHDIGRGSSGRASVTIKYKVAGLDKALAQGIAKAAYDDFVAKLRAAGYKVLTFDDIKGEPMMSGLTRMAKDAKYDMPLESGELIATPSDDMAIKKGFGGALLTPYQHFGKSTLKEGTIIVPTFKILAPLSKAETSSGSASLTLVPGMALTTGGYSLLTHSGGWGNALLRKWVFGLSDNVGTVVKTEDTTPAVANALTKVFSVLGAAGTMRKSANYTLTIDKDAYRTGALKGLSSMNDEAAKIIASVKKS